MEMVHSHETITPVSWAKFHDYCCMMYHPMDIRHAHGYTYKIMTIANTTKPLFSLPCHHYCNYFFVPFLPPLLPLLPPISSPLLAKSLPLLAAHRPAVLRRCRFAS